MDVTNKQNIQEIFENLNAKNIRIDILINNAAIDPKVDGDSGIIESSRLEGFDLSQWNLQINVGLTGAFLCSQVLGRLWLMMEKEGSS